jgi:hypothetical protein
MTENELPTCADEHILQGKVKFLNQKQFLTIPLVHIRFGEIRGHQRLFQ